MEPASNAKAPDPGTGPEPGRAKRRKLNPNEQTKTTGRTDKTDLVEQKSIDAATDAAVFEFPTRHARSDIEAQVLSKDPPEGLILVLVEKHAKDETVVGKTPEELMVEGAEPLERRHNIQDAKSDDKATGRIHAGIPSAENTTPSTEQSVETVVQPPIRNGQEVESHKNTDVEAPRDGETPRNSSSASGGGQDAPATVWAVQN